MKEILFTADLHLNINATNPRSGRTAMEDFAEAILREKPDVVLWRGISALPAMQPAISLKYETPWATVR